VLISVNAAPRGGSLSSSPTSGFALTTSFALAVYGANDPEEDLPLTYAFAATAGTQSLSLRRAGVAPSHETVLPSGAVEAGGAVLLWATVADALSASSVVNSTVAVRGLSA
jgi:hypothetical protein